MKEVTLKFREITVDGLPEKSMECMTIDDYGNGYLNPNKLDYSARYSAFNVCDASRNDDTRIDCVTHWLPLAEFRSAIMEAQNENLD